MVAFYNTKKKEITILCIFLLKNGDELCQWGTFSGQANSPLYDAVP